MARRVRDRDVARGLRLPVHAQRGEPLRLVMQLARSVEHVVRAHVHQGDVVLARHTGQQGRSLRVGLPRQGAPLRGLRPVDRGVRARVDDRAVQAPVKPAVLCRVGEVERVDVVELETLQTMRVHVGADRAAQLAVAAGDHRAARGHGLGVPEHRVVQVRLGAFGVLQRDRPLDVQVRVREVHEGVGLLLLEAPMRVHEIRVRGAILQGLETVAHATRHVDRLRWIQYGRVHLAEGFARTQVHPRAEHGARGDRDVLVPRLRVDASRHALLRVEADVILHRPEIRQAQVRLLRALPVLLEPATVVAMHRQVEHDQAGNVRLHGPQILLEIHHSLHPQKTSKHIRKPARPDTRPPRGRTRKGSMIRFPRPSTRSGPHWPCCL